VRRVVFIATPHRGSYLTEYPVTELLGRLLTLPVRIVQIGADLARNAGDFKVNPRNLGSGSLFGMTPNNPGPPDDGRDSDCPWCPRGLDHRGCR